MTTEQVTDFVKNLFIIIGAIAAIIASFKSAKAEKTATTTQEAVGSVKEDLGGVKSTVADIILKFDPLTRTLDGQLTRIQDQIEAFGNQKGRTELLAEQALTQAAVTVALASVSQPANPTPNVTSSIPTAANPLLTEDKAAELLNNQTVIADKGKGWTDATEPTAQNQENKQS